jgi:hypothetical protein
MSGSKTPTIHRDHGWELRGRPGGGDLLGAEAANGMMTRWSRPWFDWRNDPEYGEAQSLS